MYSTSWCGYCKKTHDYFNSNNIAFEEYDVETTTKGKRDYEKLVRVLRALRGEIHTFGITHWHSQSPHPQFARFSVAGLCFDAEIIAIPIITKAKPSMCVKVLTSFKNT